LTHPPVTGIGSGVLPAGASPPSRTILLIEDEPTIRDVVREAVAERGDQWLTAVTGADGLALALATPPDLVLLDLGLPDLDGLEVCRRLRQHLAAPIVVLSARHSEDEKVALLDAGADDYVTKPFGPVELRARVQAHVRRARRGRGDDPLIRVGDLRIDLERRVVMRLDEQVHLTPTEWSLLAALAANAGRTLTHQQLFRAVWGDGTFGQAQQYLRVYITHLRKKIEAVSYAPRLIITEPGVGYRFERGDGDA
jgi:two-component system KDP operon response regulator KdpE